MWLIISLLCLFVSVFSPISVFAQSPPPSNGLEGLATFGLARMIETSVKDLKDGAILSSSDHGAILSNTPYDPQVLGIVSRDAAIVFNSTGGTESGIPIISTGEVYALVSVKNGPIKKGDLLATSTIPGVAVKALVPGYVLGTAKENSTVQNSDEIEKIAIDLNLHYFNSKSPFPGSLSDILKIALFPTKDGPSPIFKYIVAGLVVLGSFYLGFVSFSRTAAKGVEALGRNPAASKIIYLGIIFNVSIVVAIILAGLTVAFLILRI